MNQSLEEKLPPTWRYNSKELRLERSVPAYGEDEEYIGHSWAAVVPEDVLSLIAEEKQKAEVALLVSITDGCRHDPYLLPHVIERELRRVSDYKSLKDLAKALVPQSTVGKHSEKDVNKVSVHALRHKLKEMKIFINTNGYDHYNKALDDVLKLLNNDTNLPKEEEE